MFDMNEFAQVITQPWMVYVFVAIILLVALRPLYQATVSIFLVNKDLGKAIIVLQAMGQERQQDEFYARFKAINGHIAKIEVLRHAWREFVDSMYFEKGAIKRAYLSHRPAYYFNRDSVLGKQLNLSQFLAYPNYLIGLGLTFTFIGLAAALHVAQAGLASGAGQQALKDLLAVASIKFISSIAGISSSLVISALQRLRIRKFQQKLTTFCDLLEECTEYKSTEKLLHDSIHEQQKQTAILGDMATNIANGIGGVLASQLPSSVALAMNPLVQEMRMLAQTFTGNYDAALKQVLDAFLTQLRQSSLDDMQGLIASVKLLKESLDGLTVNMESVGRNLSTDTKESSARLAEVMNQFATSFAPVQQSIGQFGNALSSMEGMSTKMEQAGGAIGAAATQNEKSASQLAQTFADMSVNLVPMRELLVTLSQLLGKVEATAAEVKSAGGTITASAERFGNLGGDLGNSLNELAKGSEAFRTGIQTFVTIIDDKFSKSINALDQVISELGSDQPSEKKDSSYFARLKAKWGK
jgi:hypothetical protein